VARPQFEIADIIRKADAQIASRHRESLTWPQVKVLNAILRCRTAALGGHSDQCRDCGYQAISYNSCRNRHSRNARPAPVINGWRLASANCCRLTITIWSSACLTHWSR